MPLSAENLNNLYSMYSDMQILSKGIFSFAFTAKGSSLYELHYMS